VFERADALLFGAINSADDRLTDRETETLGDLG
jgi:hypothetical protein